LEAQERSLGVQANGLHLRLAVRGGNVLLTTLLDLHLVLFFRLVASLSSGLGLALITLGRHVCLERSTGRGRVLDDDAKEKRRKMKKGAQNPAKIRTRFIGQSITGV
jgi:hypothetical protein